MKEFERSEIMNAFSRKEHEVLKAQLNAHRSFRIQLRQSMQICSRYPWQTIVFPAGAATWALPTGPFTTSFARRSSR